MNKSKTNKPYVATAIMAGHTTGGEMENSDEETAIPLEKWNSSRRYERSGIRTKIVSWKGWQRQPGGES
jgi:hypothetical protein